MVHNSGNVISGIKTVLDLKLALAAWAESSDAVQVNYGKMTMALIRNADGTQKIVFIRQPENEG